MSLLIMGTFCIGMGQVCSAKESVSFSKKDIGDGLMRPALTHLGHDDVCTEHVTNTDLTLGDINKSFDQLAKNDQLLNKNIKDTNKEIENINKKINSGELKGEKGDKGDKGERGEKGEKGEKGDAGLSIQAGNYNVANGSLSIGVIDITGSLQGSVVINNIAGKDALDKEAADRKAADKILDDKITKETTDRKAADKILDDKITKETSERKTADEKLQKQITANKDYIGTASDKGDNLKHIKKDENLSKNVGDLDRAITNVDNRIGSEVSRLDGRIDSVDRRLDKVGAMTAAIASLHSLGYDPEAPTELGAAVGTYKGSTGFALGLFHYPNKDFMLSLNLSAAGSERMGGVGATWRFK